MTDLRIIIDSAAVQRALAAGPDAARREIRQAISISIGAITRDAKLLAPKAYSVLANSINGSMVEPLTGQVAPGVDYARMAEEGTGPGGRPPLQSLVDWIRVKRIKPNDPEMSEQDLAFVMARSIAHKGTPKQPYLAPALDKNRQATIARVDAAIDKMLRTMGRA